MESDQFSIPSQAAAIGRMAGAVDVSRPVVDLQARKVLCLDLIVMTSLVFWDVAGMESDQFSIPSQADGWGSGCFTASGRLAG